MFNDEPIYTIELGEIVENQGHIFDFDYDFYDNQFRCNFESKFTNHYYFHEINSPSVRRFKRQLKAHLDLNMPEWTQLYKTELAAEGIDFLLNKDLRETFIRTVDTEDKLVGSNTMDKTGTENINGNDTVTNNLTDTKQGSVTKTDNETTTIKNQDVLAGTSSTTDTTNETAANTLTKDLTTTETLDTTNTKDLTTAETLDNSSTKTGNNSSNRNSSNIADGVASASLDPAFLTSVESNNDNISEETANKGTNTTKNTGTEKNTGTNTSKMEGTEGNEGTREANHTAEVKNDSTTTSNGQQSITRNNEDAIEETLSRTGTASTDKTATKEDTSKANGTNKEDKTGKLLEKTELISQGNIGVTSSAELLEKWRNVIINLDKRIILSCRDLFMMIY